MATALQSYIKDTEEWDRVDWKGSNNEENDYYDNKELYKELVNIRWGINQN